MDIIRKRAVAAVYQGPKSICACGHSGDGKGVGSAGESSMHAGALGHGACTVRGCSCVKFTWNGFMLSFESAVA